MSHRMRRPRLVGARRHASGLTLVEALVTLLIVVIIATSIASGVTFANVQFAKAVTLSESKDLCSTLSNAMQSELSNSRGKDADSADSLKTIAPKFAGVDAGSALIQFQSSLYKTESYNVVTLVCDADENGYGEVRLANVENTSESLPLVPSSAYAHDIGAKVEVTGTPKAIDSTLYVDHYTVKVSVANKNGEVLANNSFDVFPLEKVKWQT